MKKVFVLFLFMILVLYGCSTTDRIDTFDKVGEEALDLIAFYKTADESDLYLRYDYWAGQYVKTASFDKKIDSSLKSISTVAKNSMYKKEFFTEYINTHSIDDFVKYIYAMSYVSYEWDYKKGEEVREELRMIFDRFCEIADTGFEATSYDMIKNDDGTFYSENPKAEPQEETHIVRGKFNKPDGSIYYREVTGTTSVQYYGDYAIAHTNTYEYDEGTYGWYDGQFIDVPASFKPREYYVAYYKGFVIARADTLYDLQIKMGENKFYISEEGIIYRLASSNDFHIYTLNEE
ncbi:MAG: hypothetical protein IKM87_07010 [Clostridia bacterium]|nr:hypothetical protein [Clostridia bacterium]